MTKNPTKELLPCPFCKEKDGVTVYSIGDKWFYVGCQFCSTDWFDFGTGEYATQEQAEDAWNMRVPERIKYNDIYSCPFCGKKAGWKRIPHYSGDNEVLGCLHGCGARTISVAAGDHDAKRYILMIWNDV